MNDEDEIDDAVMANFDGLVDGMRAKRLGAEMPQEDLPEAPLPEGAEDPADEEALMAMFAEGGGMNTDPAAGERPVDEFDGPDSDKWGGSGGGPMKKMGGGMMGGG